MNLSFYASFGKKDKGRDVFAKCRLIQDINSASNPFIMKWPNMNPLISSIIL